jgi:hypothetical protein
LRRASGFAAKALIHVLMWAGRMSSIGMVPSSARRRTGLPLLRVSDQVSSRQIQTRIIAS